MGYGNVRRRENQVIRRAFVEAGDLSQVMLVGIDYAEAEHAVVICNGLGDQLGKVLTIRNDADGLAYLLKECDRHARANKIRPEQVIFGGESPGSWAENFAYGLLQADRQVVDLHPLRIKRYQEGESSTDHTSARTICMALQNREGYTRTGDDIYGALKAESHHRRGLVRQTTRGKNHIHGCCDVFFPGFLDSGILIAFGRSCRALLRRYSPGSLKKTRPSTIDKLLKKYHVTQTEQKAVRIRSFAGKVLMPSAPCQQARHEELCALLDQLDLLEHQIATCTTRLARLLRQTPGCLLTTVGGVGVVSAATLTAELGPEPHQWGADSKTCYFGLITTIFQSGGSGKAPINTGAPTGGNRIGKDILLRISDMLRRFGPEEYKIYGQQRIRNQANVRYALARKFLRFALSVFNAPHEYIPAPLRSLSDQTDPLWPLHFTSTAARLREVWHPFPTALPPEQDYLQQWQDMVNEHYHLNIQI